MSSSFQLVGRHMRGDWLKICIASPPISTARPCAFTRPPEVETCPPTSIGSSNEHEGQIRAVADGGAAHRRREDGTVQLASRPRVRAEPSSCASRTPTASAPRRRTSRRSCDALTWLGSTGTRGRSRRPSASTATARRSAGCSPTATPTRTRAPSACGSPTRAQTTVTDAIRGEIVFEHAAIDDFVIARSDGIAALQPRGRRRRPRHGDHPRRPRRRPHLQHPAPADDPQGARAPSRRSTPTCRCCTAPTARSCRSATAPRASRSCATRATCRRRSATTWPCSAGATTTPPRSSRPRSSRSASRSSACRRAPRSSTSRSCAG